MLSLQLNHRYLVTAPARRGYFEIEIIEESKNQFKIKTDAGTWWKDKQSCERVYKIEDDLGLIPGLQKVLPTIDQFNAIEDLRHYLHHHPNDAMVRLACMDYLEQNPK